jgi:hypothetical protein
MGLTPASLLRREAERFGDRNEPVALALMQRADACEAAAGPLGALFELEHAIRHARILASRLSEFDIEDDLGRLQELIVERRRRLARSVGR